MSKTAVAPLTKQNGAASTDEKRNWSRLGIVFWIAVSWVCIITFSAAFADFLPFQDPLKTNLRNTFGKMFTEGHILGTDPVGRDMLGRIVYGAQVSLKIAYTAPLISLVLGVTFGMCAGYFRGKVDGAIGIFVDAILAFPNIVAIMAILFFLGPTLLNMILVLGFFGMVGDLRVARANTILYAKREFVLAARAQGASHLRIMFKELLPNVIIPVLALAVIGMSRVIVIEGILSFLGVGLPPPNPTWGKMISEGYSEMGYAPHVTFVPAAAMFFTILSFNLIGDRLRTLTNAKTGQL
ncbi:MAG: ABC transporter permease [Rhodospirillales bacterium]|jgi:peptide/nickel transport system permease protein|nr:ABC transporter permease [Rhodospirillales bacterium]MDP7623508.1 ABC transporter permease [Rhodospirillales bacterium]|tara:strand:- start:164 stop:1051 length:888 start_codon:yes stop_codon:yes gene_type:complete